MKIYYKKKSLDIDAKKSNIIGKTLGLMFKSRDTKNLLFEFKKDVNLAIHSYFVFFPFLIIWLNNDNNVVDWHVVVPFCPAVYSRKTFRKIVEIPLNKKNTKIVDFFVGKRKI